MVMKTDNAMLHFIKGAQLDDEKSLLNQILFSGKCALFYWRKGMSNAFINDSYFRILGFDTESSLRNSTGLIPCIHPDDQDQAESLLSQAAKSPGSGVFIEFRSVDFSGEFVPMALNGQGLATGSENDQGIQGIIYVKSSVPEEDRCSSEKDCHLASLVNNLPGMAYRNKIVDGKWSIDYVSAGVKALLGYDRDDFFANKEKIYARIIEPEDNRRIWYSIMKAFNENRPFEIIYRIKTASGKYKWVWEKGLSILSSNGTLKAMEGFLMDVTPFKHKEFHLQSSLENANRDRYRFGNIIGKSPEIQKIYKLITTAAASDANTIIYGESGTGKELVARAIHGAGNRYRYPMVVVNCGAIPEHLMESEFFGYKKGAFTGAQTDKEGFLSAANGSTLFLDEVGEISLELQVKLLRVLDGYGYTPVGGRDVRKTDVRIIAATNKELDDLVKQGKMRNDFYYRIHVLPINVPPLRERKQDIPLLIDYFIKKYSKLQSYNQMPQEILDALQTYHWPGNIRELENVIQRYVVLGEIDPFVTRDVDFFSSRKSSHSGTPSKTRGLKAALGEVEKQMIIETLEKNRWRRDKTAAELKVTLRTLYRKMVLYEIN